MNLGEIEKQSDGSYKIPNWEGAVNPNLTRTYYIETPTRKFVMNCFSDIDAFHVMDIVKQSIGENEPIHVGEFGYGMWELKGIIESSFVPNSRMIGSDSYIAIEKF